MILVCASHFEDGDFVAIFKPNQNCSDEVEMINELAENGNITVEELLELSLVE